MTNRGLSETVERIVSMLVSEDYEGLEKYCHGKRLSTHDIADSVRDYGSRLVMPPRQAFLELDAIPVEQSQPPKWSVRFDLWTEDDGKSDLTLELTVVESKPGQFDAELDDLHIL